MEQLERMGFSVDNAKRFAIRDINFLQFWTAEMPDANGMEDWMAGVSVPAPEVFVLGSNGYQFEHDAYRDWQAVGRTFVNHALVYFNGDWRKAFTLDGVLHNEVSCRKVLPWSDYYRHALAMAATLSEWNSFDRLVSSVSVDLRINEGTDRRKPADNWYQMWLAARLCGRDGEAATLQASIQENTRRSAKLLLGAGLRMLESDAVLFAKALDQFVDHYRRNEIMPEGICTAICWDATVLFHLARRRGLSTPGLSELNRLFIAE